MATDYPPDSVRYVHGAAPAHRLADDAPDPRVYHSAQSYFRGGASPGTVVPHAPGKQDLFPGMSLDRPLMKKIIIDPGDLYDGAKANQQFDPSWLQPEDYSEAHEIASQQLASGQAPSDETLASLAADALARIANARRQRGEKPGLNKTANTMNRSTNPANKPKTRNGQGPGVLAELLGSKTADTPLQPPEMHLRPPTASPPSRKVEFELPSDFGTLTTRYHNVIEAGNNLIVVYDHSYPAQTLWFPPAPPIPTNSEAAKKFEPQLIGALVYGEDGQEETGYVIAATPTRFRDGTREYCVLIIAARRDRRQQLKELEALSNQEDVNELADPFDDNGF